MKAKGIAGFAMLKKEYSTELGYQIIIKHVGGK
jgi:hypothetical protein